LTYEVPEELEFFERGFGYSDEYDHDEGLFSFLLTYENGDELIFTHSPSAYNSVSVKLIQNGELVFNVYKERVSQITFQAWGNENVIRVYFSTESDVSDFLVYFNPKPRLKYAEF
jgi:hypothetical protein